VKKQRNHYARVRADGYEALVGDRHSEIAGISAPVFAAAGSWPPP
jgi:DNA-binding IclR family transcriptional regulator